MALDLKRGLETDIQAPAKRSRMSPLPTPPESDVNSPNGSEGKLQDQPTLLDRANHILTVQTTALARVADLYRTEASASAALSTSVATILSSQRAGGKLITCAVGKSAYIARKLSATCKSLAIRTSFLHGCEAAHGDLGDVCDNDVVLFVSYSGRTAELVNLLPHLSPRVPVLAISGHVDVNDCALLAGRGDIGILLPAPIYESEEESFGVSAPTTSTVVALAIGDMLALTIADELNGDRTREMFKKNHPGGAIGMLAREMEVLEQSEKTNIVDGPLSPVGSADINE